MAAPENEYSQKTPHREGDCVSKDPKELWKGQIHVKISGRDSRQGDRQIQSS